jgi:hypothetical protein
MTRVAALELGRQGSRECGLPRGRQRRDDAPVHSGRVDPELAASFSQRILSTQRSRSIAGEGRRRRDMILFLASDESGSCTGADFLVDGGNSRVRASRCARRLIDDPIRRPARPRALVVLGCLICQLGLGFGYAISPLAPDILAEFGWTRALYASAQGRQTLLIAFTSPLIGWHVARYGARARAASARS